MTIRWMGAAVLPLLIGIAACAPQPGVPGSVPARMASPGGPGSFANLIGADGPTTPTDIEVRELLRRTTAIAFPARVGIYFYDYTPPGTEEDRQAILRKVGEKLISAGVARSALPVPTGLGQVSSLEALRKLGAQLQIDVLVIVSGSSEFKRSDEQPGGWLAAFSNQANHEARTSLLGFPMDVYSGTLLPPVSGVGATAPTLLDPTVEGFVAQRRKLETDAFRIATEQAGELLLSTLSAARDRQSPATPGPATPLPALPLPDRPASATPSATPGPAGSATP